MQEEQQEWMRCIAQKEKEIRSLRRAIAVFIFSVLLLATALVARYRSQAPPRIVAPAAPNPRLQ